MDKFLAKCNLPKLNEEKGESLNRPVTAHETEAVIKKTPSTSKLWTRWFHRKILQNFKEELTTILLRLFLKIQEDRRLPNSFYEASIILIPKPDKDTKKKKIFRLISLMNIDAKILKEKNIGRLQIPIH